MLDQTRREIATTWGALQRVGLKQGLRTVLYQPRLSWYSARYDLGAGDDTPKTRSLPSSTLNLIKNMIPSSSNPSQLVGDVLAVNDIPQGVALELSDGYCTLEAITPHIVRLRLVRQQPMPDYFSYATVLEQQATTVERHEDGEMLVFSTPAIRCHVRLRPFGLHFSDAQGQTLMGGSETIAWEDEGIGFSQDLTPSAEFYGMGEQPFLFTCRGRSFTLTTRDPSIYEWDEESLYINIPFLVGMQDGIGFGVFYDSSYNAAIDIGEADPDRLRYRTTGPELRLDFILGPALPQVIERFTDLTGRMALPPLWTLGYHQSRWSYETAEIIRNLAHEFRTRRLPCEAIHFDIDYMDGFRCFTWDRGAFPDPPGLIAELHDLGFKAVGMIDPGIKIDMNYHVCADGVANDMFCKLPDRSLFHGPVWPGECYFPDFTNPRVREWWGKLYQPLLDDGFDGFWNDMNEPAIFDKQTMPDAVQHDLEGRGGDHREAHSVYGMQMLRATYEGLNRLRPNWRNWVFTRSGYAGVQRYGSSWTGDNRSEWEHLRATPAMLMNLGLSGLSFTGPDVGGFGEDCTPELYARWISMGAFTPFYRTHTAKHTAAQQPWSFGSEVEEIARVYLGWRYRFLPYLYTVFWQCSQEGTPIMRPLLYEDPANPIYLGLDDQWLLGEHLLVSPVLTPATAERELNLPAGDWYDFWTDDLLSGPTVLRRPAPLDVVPLHVRAGTVLPLGPTRQFSAEHPTAPLELHLYPGNGESTLYEDDGQTLAHRNGDFRLTRFTMRQEANRLEITREAEDGFNPAYEQFQIILHGAAIASATLDGQPLDLADPAIKIPAQGWRRMGLSTA